MRRLIHVSLKSAIAPALVLALLALPTHVLAQSTGDQAKPAPKPVTEFDPTAERTGAVKYGTIDFGLIGSSVSGDDARYNRFRDLSNGAYINNFRTRLETSNWFVNLAADHVAREDARYLGTFARPGEFKGFFMWDQIHELVSNSTRALFTQTTPGVLRVDDNVQNAMQAAIGPPNTIATVLPAMLANYNLPFELGTRRHIASGGIRYDVDKNTTLTFDANHTNREGAILYSGSFGFSNAVDIPQPIDQHTTNASLKYEHERGNMVVRAGFDGSYFRNDVSTITWDNPYRYTDATNLSGQGRTSVAPSNNFNVASGSVSLKLPNHSRFLGYVAFGFLDDNGATILPYTINSALTVLPLPRTVVGGEGETRNVNLSYVSNPSHTINFDVRYKYYDYINQTPAYTNVSRVQYDSSLQIGTPAAPITAPSAERYGGSRSFFSADMHLVAPGGGSIGVGYGFNGATYEERFFSGSHENLFHVTYDALSTQYLSLHGKYEHAIKRGQDLDTADMAAGGEQPSMRHYDIANRDRDLFTLIATVFPVNGVSFTGTAGTGNDKYPDTNFGVTAAKHYVYSLAVEVDPMDHVTLTADYTHDDFKSTQWSRTANPAPDPTYFDAGRDWSDDAHEKTNDISFALGLVRLADNKVDMRFSYDSNKVRGSYFYGLGSAPLDPVTPTKLPTPVQLPGLTSDTQRGTFDMVYALRPRVSLGFTYWYEDFKVNDLALDSKALPGLSIGTTDILMGYQYLPYTANSFFGRVVVRF